jgi:hypothetical protein
MNKEQEELVGEVYDKYTKKYVGYDDVPSKELFLFEIRNNPDFSERWGLKIEERELDLEERMDLCKEKWDYSWNRTINLEDIEWRMNNEWNIPTKLITITYNDTKIESYE